MRRTRQFRRRREREERIPFRKRLWGLYPSIIITASFLSAASTGAPVVQVCVWPGSDGTGNCSFREPHEVAVGMNDQFFAAELRSDGSMNCEVPPGANPAGCDSAIAMLDPSLAFPQDTTVRFVRIRWPLLTPSPSWSALEYHVLMQNVSNGQNLFDEFVLHPVDIYDWVPTLLVEHPFSDTAYSVRVYAVAIESASRLSGPPSEATAFVYPSPLYGPGQVGRPTVDTLNVVPPPP